MKEKNSRSPKKKENYNPNDKIKPSEIEKTIRGIICDKVQSLGYVLWDVEFRKINGDWTLAVTIDKPDLSDSENLYITMDDCMIVYKAVDPIMDEKDPVPGSYTLEVSSPGLNRELKSDTHMHRYTGRNIVVKLYAKDPELNKKDIKASLISFDNSSVTIQLVDSGENRAFDRKAVAKIYADDDDIDDIDI